MIKRIASSGITSDWCVYGNENTTTWIYGTELTVESEHSGQSFEVIATTGSALKFVLHTHIGTIDSIGFFFF